jgi:hypothetical protein
MNYTDPMQVEQFKSLKLIETAMRVLAGPSRPLPFIWIDHVFNEAFMNSKFVSVAEAVRAAQRLTDKQWRRAEKRGVIMVMLAWPTGDAGPKVVTVPPAPLVILHAEGGTPPRNMLA